MGEMASGFAHELNQPLTAIANFAQAGSRVPQRRTPILKMYGLRSTKSLRRRCALARSFITCESWSAREKASANGPISMR